MAPGATPRNPAVRPRGRPPVAKTSAKAAKKKDENRAPTPPPNMDALQEQLERKYNIEGSNKLDIVYARINGDAAQGQSYSFI